MGEALSSKSSATKQKKERKENLKNTGVCGESIL
jgi:hypothetical protein